MHTTDTASSTHIVPTGSLPLVPGAWALDPAHSTVTFAIRHLGVAKVRGRFDRFDADVTVGTTAETSVVSATVDLASVDTGNPDRDAHIRAEDMLDVSRRPTMVFRSTSLSGAGDGWRLAGDLTIGDVTRPLILDVELGGVAEFPLDGSRRAGITATGELRRSDFDIAPSMPAPLLGEVVRVELDLELIEPR